VPILLWATLGLFILGALGALKFWPLLAATPTVKLAEVTVTSNPPGATVLFNGDVKLEQVTPVRLPSMPAGKYPVRLSLAGYEDLETRVTIPPSGEHTLKPVSLSRAKEETTPLKVTSVGTEALPVKDPEPRLKVGVTSDPVGAQVLLNGALKGHTPLSFEEKANTQVRLRVEKAGYVSMVRSFKVAEGALEQSFTLEKATPRQTVASGGSGGTGKISFVLTPLEAWADVTCGGRKVGQAPMAAQDFPVGTYDCTFANPDLGTRTAHFEVKSGVNKPVRVQF
jgi:hypothetical protein